VFIDQMGLAQERAYAPSCHQSPKYLGPPSRYQPKGMEVRREFGLNEGI